MFLKFKCLLNLTSKVKDSEDVGTIKIYLHTVLPFPKTTVYEAYYRRNMYCYSLGIQDMKANIGYMSVWDETVASRGSQEISACLIKHVKQHPNQQIISYSDICAGQKSVL